jgi:hypothetical protein
MHVILPGGLNFKRTGLRLPLAKGLSQEREMV